MRALDERAAEQVVPFAWGRALINRQLPLVHDANYLLADRLDGASAAALIGEAERIQGGLALRHRRVNVDDEPMAETMLNEFEAAGYVAERFTVMVNRGTRAAVDVPSLVHEVTWEQVRSSRRRQRLRETWAFPELVDQILDRQALTARLIPTRYFGAIVEGQVVASCELRTSGPQAQLETVETLEPFRNRGYGSAVIGAALDAAREHEFVFLVTDHDDWPQHWYRRFGFEPVGLETRFLQLVGA